MHAERPCSRHGAASLLGAPGWSPPDKFSESANQSDCRLATNSGTIQYCGVALADSWGGLNQLGSNLIELEVIEWEVIE